MANMYSTPENSIFNRLTYIKPRDTDLSSNGYALFRCVCGAEKYIKFRYVASGGIKSCGCLRDEAARKSLLTHGHSQSPKGSAYGSWENMLQRCNNPKSTGYMVYGGRGISVCARWLSFENFIEDMGPRPSANHSIDRIDNDGNYEPGNCRWATRGEQASNTSRSHTVQLNGEVLNIAQLALKTGVTVSNLRHRIKSGMPIEKVVSSANLNCRMIEYGGISLSMFEWERRLGLSRGVIETRLRRGKSVADALAPVKPRHRKK